MYFVRKNKMLLPFWKDSINFSILSSFICSFFQLILIQIFEFFRLPIRLSSFICPCVRFLITSPSRDVLAIKLNVTRALPALRAVVGLDGLEPSTSRLSGARSSHLSYRPLSISVDMVPIILVEMMGIEPMTPCLQGRCSPN